MEGAADREAARDCVAEGVAEALDWHAASISAAQKRVAPRAGVRCLRMAGDYAPTWDGAPGMVAERLAAGFDATPAVDAAPPGYDGGSLPASYDAVIVGLDPEFGYRCLAAAAAALRAGARFIATNADARYPTPSGFLP